MIGSLKSCAFCVAFSMFYIFVLDSVFFLCVKIKRFRLVCFEVGICGLISERIPLDHMHYLLDAKRKRLNNLHDQRYSDWLE